MTDYIPQVIKTFADKHTEALFATGRSRRLPPEVLRRDGDAYDVEVTDYH